MQIAGTLLFLGWWHPTWLLDVGAGERVDLKTVFWDFAEANRGKLVTQQYKRDDYALRVDDASQFELRFEERGGGIAISRREGFGFFNVLHSLETTMVSLGSRRVLVHAGDGSFEIKADPTDEVFGVLYAADGNSAVIPEGAEKSVCGLGAGVEACIYLSLEKRGFRCQKFDPPIARQLLGRLATGEINARRVGNCACIGREEAAS